MAGRGVEERTALLPIHAQPRMETPTRRRAIDGGSPTTAAHSLPPTVYRPQSTVYRLLQPAARDLVLVPAEEMPELVQVGDAHLVTVDRRIALGMDPEVFEEQQNLRRQRRRRPVIVLQIAADKQPEDVRLDVLVLQHRALGERQQRH